MKKDQIINALVTLAKKRVVPYARTRYNIIPGNDQEVATPRSRLLGTLTYVDVELPRQPL
eukprot:12918161-Prorocentrum_lima.AAC.1